MSIFYNHQRKVKGRYHIAEQTAQTIRVIVASTKKTDTVQQVMDALRKFGAACSRALPTDMVIGNIVRRVLFIIRDEYKRFLNSANSKDPFETVQGEIQTTSLSNILEGDGFEEIDFNKPFGLYSVWGWSTNFFTRRD